MNQRLSWLTLLKTTTRAWSTGKSITQLAGKQFTGSLAIHLNLQLTQSSATSTHLNCVTDCDHSKTAVCVCCHLFVVRFKKPLNKLQHVKNELNSCKKRTGRRVQIWEARGTCLMYILLPICEWRGLKYKLWRATFDGLITWTCLYHTSGCLSTSTQHCLS